MLSRLTFGWHAGFPYSLIFPKSSPVARNLPDLDLAQVLRSEPSTVSGQTPTVAKPSTHVCVAHSTSRSWAGFAIGRQIEAFPGEKKRNQTFPVFNRAETGKNILTE